jgi:hypothetical protein
VRARFGFTFVAAVGGAVLSACAGDAASSAPHVGASLPVAGLSAAAGRVPAPAGTSATRRTLTSSPCSGAALGTNAFIAAGYADYAPGYAALVGGAFDEACDEYTVVAGGYYNVIYSGNGTGNGQSFIGAGNANSITGSSSYNSAIVGGKGNSIVISDAFVGGGDYNSIGSGGTYGVIAGGQNNTVSAQYGFIGAGLYNTVSGEGAYIAAGGYNTASGEGAVVDGGFNQTASGTFATVPGGYVNSAAGTYSFAAGARASAPLTGDFVWSDGSDGDTILTASRTYQFLARASGGFTLYTNAGSTVGAQLGAGSGTWASLSDRNAKTAIVPLDDDVVLAKVDALPISRWSYKSERGVRHVGPMAQDFYAAFKVGEDDRHITSIDEDGVALAAIKALHAENARLRRTTSAQTAGLRTEVAGLRAEVAALRALVEGRAAR